MRVDIFFDNSESEKEKHKKHRKYYLHKRYSICKYNMKKALEIQLLKGIPRV